MGKIWTGLRALSPFFQGLLGAALVVLLYLVGSWTYARYTEFTVMRQVISQIIENDRKQQAAQHPPPRVTPGAAEKPEP
jgi:hypothetical protein